MAVAKSFAVRTQLHLTTAEALTDGRNMLCPCALLYVRGAYGLDLTTDTPLIILDGCGIEGDFLSVNLACAVAGEGIPTRTTRVEVQAELHSVDYLSLLDDSNHGLRIWLRQGELVTLVPVSGTQPSSVNLFARSKSASSTTTK